MLLRPHFTIFDLVLAILVLYINIVCLLIFYCFAFSKYVTILFLISGGAIPDEQYILLIDVGQRCPLIARHESTDIVDYSVFMFNMFWPTAY